MWSLIGLDLGNVSPTPKDLKDSAKLPAKLDWKKMLNQNEYSFLYPQAINIIMANRALATSDDKPRS